MPHPDQPNPSGHTASRRAFLRGLLGVAGAGALSVSTLAGCDLFGSDPAPPGEEPPPQELRDFLTATVALGARYDAALAAADALPATVSQIRDAHRAHAQALAKAIGAPTPAPSSADAGDTPTGRDEALATLLTAERTAHQDAVKACLASSPDFAALLGSIAAGRATHVVGLS